MRLGVYQQNEQIVEELNRTNTGVTFELNFTADQTTEEFLHSQGLNTSLIERDSVQLSSNDDDFGGRRLEDNYSINWVSQGKVTPVKNQGGCGSCWAFAATTAQEAMQSIKYGSSPVRLSEQEGVDCTSKSHGCGGGWMSHYWEFSAESSSQSNSDYPYEAATR